MTIETKRFNALPWAFPGNAKEIKTGEVLCKAVDKYEGLHIWTLMAMSPDKAEVSYCSPFTVTLSGKIIPDHEQFSKSTVEKGEINLFGPEDRPWRWRP